MTDEMVIAAQARKIARLEADVLRTTGILKAVKMQLVRVGGPLNDNQLRYNKDQLVLFFKIQDILDGCIG